MAYVGFRAHLADGREVCEGDGPWDSVPDTGIVRLSLWRDWQDEIVALESAPGRRFFFMNEGVATKGGHGCLAAKVLGYIDGDTVHVVRLEASHPELMAALGQRRQPALDMLTERKHSMRDFPISSAALRRSA